MRGCAFMKEETGKQSGGWLQSRLQWVCETRKETQRQGEEAQSGVSTNKSGRRLCPLTLTQAGEITGEVRRGERREETTGSALSSTDLAA